MYRVQFLLLAAILLASSLITSSAQAGILFALQSFKGATPTTLFDIGDTVTMRVVAQNDPANPGSPTLGGGTTWQAGGGFNALITASNATANAATAPTTSLPTFIVGGDSNPFNGTGRGFLGFTFAAGQATTSPMTLFQFDYLFGGTTTFGFNTSIGSNNQMNLSTGTFGTTNGIAVQGLTVQLNAIPEPSSLALCGVVGMAAAAFRFRRRRRG